MVKIKSRRERLDVALARNLRAHMKMWDRDNPKSRAGSISKHTYERVHEECVFTSGWLAAEDVLFNKRF